MPTFRAILTRSLLKAGIVLLVVAAWALPVALLSPTPTLGHFPDTPSRADVLTTNHGCWTGNAPADMEGKMPGHVVVTDRATSQTKYAGEVMVGKALDQIFNGHDHGIDVASFCR